MKNERTRSRLSRSNARAVGVALFIAACGGTLGKVPSLGSESHFLAHCADACSAGLECIGGICTRTCLTESSSCSDLGAGAQCTNQSVEPGQVAVCDVSCAESADCASLGADYRCEVGYCRSGGVSDPAPNSPGSGSSGPATPIPNKCLAMDVRVGQTDCNAGQTGWFYDGGACVFVDCCSGTQCGRGNLTQTRAECEERHAQCQSWQAGTRASECVGQEAWAGASCEDSTLRFAWRGETCDRISCACVGRDCGALWDNQFECVRDNIGCDALAPARADCLRNNPVSAVPPLEMAESQDNCLTDGGTDCDAAGFISREAALCIARAAGLAPGLSDWEAGLGYHYGHRRIIWGVSTTLRDDGPDGQSGASMVLDARTGILIEELGWESIP
jgi:hypothetical protein